MTGARSTLIWLTILTWLFVGDLAHGATAQDSIVRLLRQIGCPVGKPAGDKPRFVVLKAVQDYRRPLRDRCCHTKTPLCIGRRHFKKGIGAHANGRIVVELDRQFQRFHALVGIDNNWDTQGKRGSAEFIVKVDGKLRYHSPVCRGGDEPREVDVDVRGARKLELVVTDAGDSYNYDQADWALATLTDTEGRQYFIGDQLEQQMFCPWFLQTPTRFRYGGKDCWQLFATWKRTVGASEHIPGGARYQVTWTDPQTQFRATLHLVLWSEPAALELQWELANGGSRPSLLVTEACSIALANPADSRRTVLTSCSGGLTGTLQDTAGQLGFAVSHTPLGEKTLTVHGGRSSNGDLPFFLLHDQASGWSIAAALDWSGQWRAQGKYDESRQSVSFCVGMQPVHFRLAAGQSVRLPGALLVPLQGTETAVANRLRQILQTHYRAVLSGKSVPPPVSFNSWFVFHNDVNANMLAALADKAAPLGIEYFCLDAGWFEGDFPKGVGNWTINQKKFPQGLRPVADHVHQLGMKFGLWFEPERVAPGTRWAVEHPDLVVDGLLDMRQSEAQELVFNMLDRYIRQVGVDWIRYDFNIDPLSRWQQMEDSEHQGLAQLRYMEGLYSMLDRLRRAHPNLFIEQCSSGGRRIDVGTIRRGHTFWKSDNTSDQALMRFHETGGNLMLPGGLLNTNLLRYRSPYEPMALFAGPLGFGLDFRKLTPSQAAELKKLIAAYKRVRHLINQDYAPIFPQDRTGTLWSGWEFVDRKKGDGFFVVYRPANSPYCTAEIPLAGIDERATYRIENLWTGAIEKVSGRAVRRERTVTLEPDTAQLWYFVSLRTE